MFRRLLRGKEVQPIYLAMTRSLPILPLRDIVVFPHRIVPLFVGREKSVAALEAAMAADKELFLVAQLDPGEDDPDRDALYDLGVIATAMQLLKLPDGTVRVLVEGVKRARDRKSTRLNSSHSSISYAVFCLKKKTAAPHQTL